MPGQILRRMRHFAFTLLLVMVFGSSEGQSFDSLISKLQAYPHQDTTRVQLLLAIAKKHTTRDISQQPILLKEAISLSVKIDFKKGQGLALNALAKHYILKGEFDKALAKTIEAKKIMEKLDYEPGLISSQNVMARVYSLKGQLKKALALHLENVDRSRNNPPSSDKAGLYFYVAKTLESLKDYDRSIDYYEEALNISRQVNYNVGVAIAEGSIGNVYNLKKDYSSAVYFLNRTLEHAKENNHLTNVAAASFALGESYEGLKDLDKALQYNTNATAIYKKLDNQKMLKECYANQARLFEKKGMLNKANQFLKEQIQITDSVFSEDRLELTEQLQAKYESDKKEREIKTLAQESEIKNLQLKQQRFLLAGISGLSLLILGGGILLIRQRKLKEKQKLTNIELNETKKRLKLERQFRDSELKALRSQMNPHFVFNALNSIQEYIMTNERKLAGKYLGKFADLMRIYLNHSQVKFIPVSEEIEALNLYMELEGLRFENTLTYHINVDDAVDHQLEIPSLLWQPYVENAFKHGLLHKSGERVLNVNFKQDDDSLTIEVIDNGVGRKKSSEINKLRNPDHKSFASDATKSRLGLLNQDSDFPITEKIEDIYDDDGNCAGTKVVIKIPID